MRFDEQFMLSVIPDAEFLSKNFPESARFSIDSRELEPGDIFVAISGTHADGHDFIADAFKRGAAGVIASREKKEIFSAFPAKELAKTIVVLVADPLEALCQLAFSWRAQFKFPVVAITGSVGKTSTKQLLTAMLDAHNVRYLVSRGNQNTRLGIALNIMRMRPEHEVAVFEVGINQRGEMEQLAALLRPTTALITGIGHAHMEGLGSLVDIALEKRDLFKYFFEHNIGIINGDQLLLSRVSYAHPVIKFGTKTTNQFQARKIKVAGSTTSFVLKIYKDKHIVELANPHQGSIFNCLAAAATAHQLGVSQAAIIQGIQSSAAVEGRFEHRLIAAARGTIINDCYNANPESMKAALLALQNVQTGAKKIAVLGDMLELGQNSPFWHRQVGRFLRKVPTLSRLILVGQQVAWIKKTAPIGLPVELVPTWQEAVAALEGQIDTEAVVLVKGSRGMQLNNVVTHFSKT